MGSCWYCHWGWPEEVAKIFIDAVDELGGDDTLMRFGPAHVVWEDENFDSAQWCLDHFEEYRRDEYTDEAHEIVRNSLKKLAALPENLREAKPKDYDDEHPENYPPPEGIRMVRVWILRKSSITPSLSTR